VDAGRVEFIDNFEGFDPSKIWWWTGSEGGGSKLGRVIRLRRCRGMVANGGVWMPYPPFPSNVPLLAEGFPEEERKIGVLFCGTSNESYDSASVREFGLMTRVEILESLFDSGIEYEQYEDLDREAGTGGLFLPSYDGLSKIALGRISAEHYLDVLKRTSFFIAAPGRSMPFSHNVVEAMGCGSIPILQYGNYFSPALEDGKNCLVFHDRKSLVEVIEKAMEMDEDEIERMRESVRSYYSEHLHFEVFLQKLNSSPQRQYTVDYYS
jgi:glycosyltransferase involved in cell wall biosynthesis